VPESGGGRGRTFTLVASSQSAISDVRSSLGALPFAPGLPLGGEGQWPPSIPMVTTLKGRGSQLGGSAEQLLETARAAAGLAVMETTLGVSIDEEDTSGRTEPRVAVGPEPVRG